MSPRYAIYFVPGADSDLYHFGATVLGYDTYAGISYPVFDDAPARWNMAVAEPRFYGFHATLKPPFYLADGARESHLVAAATEFAANHPAVAVGEIAPRELGSFIALVPSVSRPLLDRLAETCVTRFDPFRAQMSDQERARRLTPGLSNRQIENLTRWGYPYVFADFRFHMTLTGPLAQPRRTAALRFLCDKFEKVPNAASLVVDRIVIATQEERSSPFQVIATAPLAPLGQSPSRPEAYPG